MVSNAPASADGGPIVADAPALSPAPAPLPAPAPASPEPAPTLPGVSTPSTAPFGNAGDVKKLWQVDTSYIDWRTKDVNNLEPRRESAAALGASPLPVAVAPSGTTKKEGDGKWRVDTSYIGYRTGDPSNLVRNGENGEVIEPSKKLTDSTVRLSTIAGQSGVALPSGTVKKEGDGKWKVDTSYIGYRTIDTGNLTRNIDDEQARWLKEDSEYADPSEKKYRYEEIRNDIGSRRPKDVNPTCKEQYLTSEEFQSVVGLSMEAFVQLPKWKQSNIKKAKDLF